MKLATFNTDRVGIVEGDTIFDVTSAVPVGPSWPPTHMNSLIYQWQELKASVLEVRESVEGMPLSSVSLGAPVPAPLNLVAAPANYSRHIAEMGPLGSGRSMRKLGFFLLASSSILAPGGRVILPKGSEREFHHECELAVVIGKPCKNVPVAAALEYVFGYTCVMDLTMRMTESHKEERVMRKSFDTFTPMGPWIVTADEISDPQQLTMELFVNNTRRQSATTADMIVSVAEQISLISSVMTLQPGDVVATGTPDGVGQIRPGDTVRIGIEGLGGFSVDVAESAVYAPVQF
jgi:2-keto-4-pentenoate hydratase/2-oxohepta-3-ene-1,7-dioic acid hydratase in catechol pathway